MASACAKPARRPPSEPFAELPPQNVVVHPAWWLRRKGRECYAWDTVSQRGHQRVRHIRHGNNKRVRAMFEACGRDSPLPNEFPRNTL